ncbi:MAG: hypothetical protein QXX99_07070 [Candidatus Bathyarchaeia archaeon]
MPRIAYENTAAYKKYGISWEEFKKRKIIVFDSPTWDEYVKIESEWETVCV